MTISKNMLSDALWSASPVCLFASGRKALLESRLLLCERLEDVVCGEKFSRMIWRIGMGFGISARVPPHMSGAFN